MSTRHKDNGKATAQNIAAKSIMAIWPRRFAGRG
jgi:hypothetical protein